MTDTTAPWPCACWTGPPSSTVRTSAAVHPSSHPKAKKRPTDWTDSCTLLPLLRTHVQARRPPASRAPRWSARWPTPLLLPLEGKKGRGWAFRACGRTGSSGIAGRRTTGRLVPRGLVGQSIGDGASFHTLISRCPDPLDPPFPPRQNTAPSFSPPPGALGTSS